MSIDVMAETFFLTPKGWQTKRPLDERMIVEVWDLDIYSAVGWDEEYHHWTCMWVTPEAKAWPLEKRNDLRAQHAFPVAEGGRMNVAASVGWPLPESRSGMVYTHAA